MEIKDNDLLYFKTETFEYKTYSNNKEEEIMLEEFMNDSLTKLYLKDFLYYIKETEISIKENEEISRYTTIIYKDNYPVGLLSLFSVDKNRFIISMELDLLKEEIDIVA